MGVVNFPDGSRHGAGRPEPVRQLGTEPITPTEPPPSGAWPDESACDSIGRAVAAVDELSTRAQSEGLDDVQQAAEDALSALQRLDGVLGDHFDGPVAAS